MIDIKTAEDALEAYHDLSRQLNSLPFNRDLRKYHNNIYQMISDLSQLEVYARRTHSRSRWAIARNRKQAEVTAAMKYLDQLLLIARLMA